MHELPITESVLSIAVDTAAQNGGGRITAINLVLGDLTSIVDDSVQFYFDILSKDTLAEGARLNFERRPAVATCQDCRFEAPVTPPIDPHCPHCHGSRLMVTGGKEFFIKSIEVEDEH